MEIYWYLAKRIIASVPNINKARVPESMNSFICTDGNNQIKLKWSSSISCNNPHT